MTDTSLSGLHEAARRAFANTSFSPDRRAKDSIQEWSAELESDLKRIELAAVARGKDPAPAIADYAAKFENLLSGIYTTESRCASAMITGPANFPVRQQEKRRQTANKKYEEFREWRLRAVSAICKSYAPPVTPELELEKVKADLAACEKNQELMKAINKVIRTARGRDCTIELQGLGLTPELIDRIMTPVPGGGSQSFRLQNNNQNIKRLRSRVAELTARVGRRQEVGESEERIINGVRLVANYAHDRMQMFFDPEPDAKTKAELHATGWHFSYTNRCWQRKLTSAAIRVAKKIAGSVIINEEANHD